MGAARKPVLPVMVVCCVLVGWLVWSAVPALAAAPETPEVSVEGLVYPTTTATVHGVLNPGVEGVPGTYEVGTYEFLYRKGKAGCEGEGKAPVSPGISLGAGKEAVREALSGLVPGTEYSVCLLARNGIKGEQAVSLPVTFTTSPLLEAPTIGEPASTVTATTITFQDELNPGGAPGSLAYRLDYNTNGKCTGGQSTTPVEVAEAKQLQVQVEATGLEPNDVYTFCLVVENLFGEEVQGSEVSVRTGTHAPAVTEASVGNVGSAGASVSLRIDPFGLSTTYEVQYGPTTGYGSSTGPVSVGDADSSFVSGVELSHLTPDSEYHYRIVASSEAGSEQTTDATFMTTAAASPVQTGLPDGRVYEMVTPPENDDADVYVPLVLTDEFTNEGQSGIPTQLLFQASEDGNAVTYVADPTSGGDGNSGFGEGNEYLARRSATGGWSQVNLQPPGLRSPYYQAFSNDLSVGVLQSGAGESVSGSRNELDERLSTEARAENYKVLYRHRIGEAGYEPFFSKSVPLHRTASEFGSNGFHTTSSASKGVLAYVGGSTDMSHLFFEANDALTENAVDGGAGEDNLYESVDGKLSLVNVLPGGGAEPNARFGGPGEYGPNLRGEYDPDLSHVISTNGSRAFWAGLGTGDVYMTENAGSAQERTVQVDKAVGGGGTFWTATGDGSKVFFTKGDLYEYDINTGATIDLTPGVEVQGVIGASEDGEYVYYVDSEYKLNVWHAGSSKLIATLSSQDNEEALGEALDRKGGGKFGDWQVSMDKRTAEVTSDGHSIVFMAFESLTGYDNEAAGHRLGEVYIYDAEGNRLTCASCNPSGEAPQTNIMADFSFGGFLPPSWNVTFTPQWMSSDGSRVFFDSSEPLVPQDTNGTVDVYEWERDDSGTCHETAGCVYLLSGGVNASTSSLVAESSSGNDVFMVSRAQLVAGIENEAFNLYDVSVNGSRPVSPPACSGTGCQGIPAAPPVFAVPPSVTFSGVGNFLPPVVSKATSKKKALTRAQKLSDALRACKTMRGRERGKCEASARKRFGARVGARGKSVVGVRKGGKS